MARVATAITQFQTNNNGRIPGQTLTSPVTCDGQTNTGTGNEACMLLNRYLRSTTSGVDTGGFSDPDGRAYIVSVGRGTTGVPTTLTFNHTVYVRAGTLCNGETITAAGAQTRSYSILYKLEGSGVYCADNK